MARESFVFYRSFFEAISLMPSEVQAEVYPALAEYALYGTEPEGLSDIARGVFILVKPNIDAGITRYESGRKGAQFGKLGGRPAKEAKAAKPDKPAKDKGEAADPPSAYTLSLRQEIDAMKADRTWHEPVCMQFHISAEEFSERLEAFLNHCQCEYEGKPHKDLNDAKRHFISWCRKAYPPSGTGGAGKEQPPCDDNPNPNPKNNPKHNNNGNNQDYRPTGREREKARRDAEFAQYIACKLAGGGDGVP